MELNGKVIVINDEENVSASFKKRLLVIETEEQYVQKIPIDFVQGKCSILDNYQVGQNVKVSVNIRGNEYNGKYYVSLNGWRIEEDGAQHPIQKQEENAQTGFAPSEEPNPLPF